jgi:excisionase family DNA binding protein
VKKPLRHEPVPPLSVQLVQAAALLGISERKLWELKATGKIPCVRIGRSVRFRIQDLEEFIERNLDAGMGGAR